MHERPAIVGVGNVLMGDDGAGPAAVEALRRAGLADRADLFDAGLAFSEVLCELEPHRPLVVIDAVRGGGEPGSIYRLGLADLDAGRAGMAGAYSLHELSVLPALRMEALAGRVFEDVTIFGIEPAQVAWGEGLSRPVARAVEMLPAEICHYLDDCAARGHTGAARAARGSEKP